MKIIIASGLALALGVTAAAAQGNSSSSSSGSKAGKQMQMTQADCQSMWTRVDTGKSGSITETQAQPYVAGFKSVDTNGDGKLSNTEFMTACQKGLVHDSATTGASGGTSGASGSSTMKSGTGTGATGSGSAGTGSTR